MGEKYFGDLGHPRFLGSVGWTLDTGGSVTWARSDPISPFLYWADKAGLSCICKEGESSSQPIQFTFVCIDNNAGNAQHVA